MPICLYLVYTTTPNEALLQKIIPFLPQATQNKIAKHRFITDQWRVALTDLLLRKTLANELEISLEAIKIEIDSYGKPFLKGKTRQFNLSHAEDIIILATDDMPIGIDTEYVRPLDDLKHLLEHFSEDEKQALLAKNKEQQLDFFYDLWTLKESYVKALGKGLSCSLQSFSITVSEKEAFLSKSVNSDISWYFKRYTFGTHYKCAVCARRNQFPEQVIIVDYSDLLELCL